MKSSSGPNRKQKRQDRPELIDALRLQVEQEAGVGGFAEMLADVPVVIIVCAQRPVSEGPWTVGPFGQTYPAIQNLLLAACALGLGGTITTGYRWMEPEIKEWLGLPEGIDSTCLIPLGYPLGTGGERHGKKTRKPIEELVYEEHWGQTISF